PWRLWGTRGELQRGQFTFTFEAHHNESTTAIAQVKIRSVICLSERDSKLIIFHPAINGTIKTLAENIMRALLALWQARSIAASCSNPSTGPSTQYFNAISHAPLLLCHRHLICDSNNCLSTCFCYHWQFVSPDGLPLYKKTPYKTLRSYRA